MSMYQFDELGHPLHIDISCWATTLSLSLSSPKYDWYGWSSDTSTLEVNMVQLVNDLPTGHYNGCIGID